MGCATPFFPDAANRGLAAVPFLVKLPSPNPKGLTMKVSRYRKSEYIITLHGHSFTIAKLEGCKDWTLWNAKQVEINRAETKSGMLELMRQWSPERTKSEAKQEDCPYA